LSETHLAAVTKTLVILLSRSGDPQGWQGPGGAVDVLADVPGDATVDVETTSVPEGTALDVRVNPRFGQTQLVQQPVIDGANCDGSGNCTAQTVFNLSASRYSIQAESNFTAPQFQATTTLVGFLDRRIQFPVRTNRFTAPLHREFCANHLKRRGDLGSSADREV
jgi:hypothetical protein